MRKMQENTDKNLAKSRKKLSTLHGPIGAAIDGAGFGSGLRHARLLFRVRLPAADLITVYRESLREDGAASCTSGSRSRDGLKGQIWSAASLGVLLSTLGDTIRISLTPKPGGDRRRSLRACELLQALAGSFAPSVTACPGCGRTTSTEFQDWRKPSSYIRDSMPPGKRKYEGVENMTLR